MQKISTEEIVNYKILPFNIYSEFGEKLFSAGEVLTPGKLLQLRQAANLFKDDDGGSSQKHAKIHDSDESKPSTKSENISGMHQELSSLILEVTDKNIGVSPIESEEKTLDKQKQPSSNSNVKTNHFDNDVVIEKFDMNADGKAKKDRLTVDNVDIFSYKGPINKKAKIAPEVQIKIKAFYNKILEMIDASAPTNVIIDMFMNIRDKIVQDILFETQDVYFCSQLKLLGEYNKCHALNTAILSGALAKKMELKEENVFDIVFAGLLHDIGKTRISEDILSKTNLTHQEQKIIESHTQLGYKIIKEEMDLPEKIARVALEHHENNDGSGYPYGKSGDWIGRDSQIINVCNYFDNVTSNRTTHKVKNIKDSMHVLLELGSKRFSAEALYTFVHMFNYNDTINFEEMIL